MWVIIVTSAVLHYMTTSPTYWAIENLTTLAAIIPLTALKMVKISGLICLKIIFMVFIRILSRFVSSVNTLSSGHSA